MALDGPWRTVLSLVVRFEDALALMAMFEAAEVDLAANGVPSRDASNVMIQTERGFAALLADRMLELEGGDWSYTHFYATTRAPLESTPEEIAAFTARCADAGVTFGEAPLDWERE